MGYLAVPTVNTGDSWTAAQHNTYIRDNFAAGVPDIYTAAGDMPYGIGANSGNVLNIGSSGDLLGVTGGATAPEWQSPVYAQVTRTANQAINNSTETAVQWDNESYDTDDLHDNTTNPERITIPSAGWYLFAGAIDFAANNAGFREIRLYRNGGALGLEVTQTAINGGSTVVNFSFAIYASAADYIEVRVWQNSGGGLNVSPTNSILDVFKLR